MKADMGRRIDELSPAKRALLEKFLAKRDAGAQGIQPRAGGGLAPASFAQELLWMLDRSTPGVAAYHAGRALRLRGPLDRGALQQAIDATVARHEALRTTFEGTDAEPQLIVHPPVAVPVEFIDLRSVAATDRDAQLSRVLGEVSRRPFNLAFESQFRVALVALAPDDHALILVGHHIALDGWSFDVVVKEMVAIYGAALRGEPASLPALPIGYGDYAAWQRDRLSGTYLQQLLDYWRERLAGAREELPLPTDWPRPARPGFEGGQRTIVLPGELLDRIRQTATQNGATLYSMLVAAYVTLLHRYSGVDDIVIGSPTAGRARTETERLVGYFANTLVLRVDCSGDPTFTELLGRVRETWLGALEHQEIPLEKLVMELQKGRQLGHAPLFQCTLTMENAESGVERLTTGDLDIVPLELDSGLEGSAKFDLLLLVAERADGLRALLQYRTDLFRGETAERILGHLASVLASAAANPAQRLSHLPLLTDAERSSLAEWGAGPAMTPVSATLTSLISAAADRDPSRVAVVCGDDSITFGELQQRTSQLANRLVALGAAPGATIGLCLPKSVDAIVALVGILKAGGAYSPFAPELPAARVAQQLREGGVRIVITRSAHAPILPAQIVAVRMDDDSAAIAAESGVAPTIVSSADDTAYVLFTSGSTGVPKGVQVTHRNAVNYARAISRVLANIPANDPNDGLAALAGWQFGLASTLAADLGNTSLLPALCAGGTLHVLEDAVTTDPTRFAEHRSRHRLDVLKITPNHLRALLGDRPPGEAAAVLPRRWIVLGGEALTAEFATRLLAANGCRVLNHYGPTEATVGCATFEVTADSLANSRAVGAQTVPIGRPLAGASLHVLDRNGTATPVGVTGELWIGGAGVARGYVNRADLTAERFTGTGANRMYRTGDLVRWLPIGAVEFLGRADDQVKIRGYRVELAEISQVLLEFPGVAECAVIARSDGGNGETTVIAYVVVRKSGYGAAHGEQPTPENLTAFASQRLPEYAVPSAVVVLERLPLTANGKLDRAALPSPEESRREESYVAPRSDTERALAQIWAEVLKVDRVSITDDFLKLGGHSLLAIRILGKITRTMGVRLPLRALFDAPTIERLAQQVEAARAAAAPTGTGA